MQRLVRPWNNALGRFVYAILMQWPGSQIMLKNVRPKPGSNVEFLCSKARIAWTFDSAKGAAITLPESLQQASNRPCNFAWSLKFEEFKA